MKVARVSAGYIVTLWLLVVVLLGSVLLIGYRRNRNDLTQLMINEAERFLEVVSVSTAAGIHALDEVEDMTASRLLDNARLLEYLIGRGIPHPDMLAHIAVENDLHLINIIDQNGRSLSRIAPQDKTPVPGEKKHRPEVESVLDGTSEEEVIGFMDGRYYGGKPYGVVVKRHDGGAVIINTDSERMLAFRKSVGPGKLFREIGSREGIRYIVLQDTLGILAASQGVTEMSRIQDDEFLSRAAEGESLTRIIHDEGGGILEVVAPLIVDEYNLGLVRIGLSTATIDGIRSRALRQFFLLFIVSVISGMFVFGYLMLRQNYMILNAEHDRILGEVRHMEEERRRTERLTSMGLLAAGVAHEIRNPLNAISIITQRITTEFTVHENETEYRGFLSTIVSEINRIGSIIENFLAYARPPKLSFSTVSAEQLVSEVVNIVGEKARNTSITIEKHIQSGATCRCDHNQMKQALLNIVLNALEAAGSNGTVKINGDKTAGGFAFRVSDSGPGIPRENLTKIFDPYFTTKSSGSGLGLSEVHRIVTAHGGRIIAGNGERGGAVFSIIMPTNGEQ